MSKRLTIFIIVGFSVLCFFTLLFLNFYSKNYKQIKSEEGEILEQIITEEVNGTEEVVLPEINTESMISVFDRDLSKKKEGSSLKSLNSTGSKELSDSISKTVKSEILKDLYSNDINKAISDATYVKENYDFSNTEYSDLELFVYETLNILNNYSENINTKTKIGLIGRLKSPEIILFVFNKYSLEERISLSQNTSSEVYNETFPNNIGLTILNYGDEGVETCGADNVFFVTSGYSGHYIKFKTISSTYNFYYLIDESTDTTLIMGVDNLNGEYTTIKEYLNIYS